MTISNQVGNDVKGEKSTAKKAIKNTAISYIIMDKGRIKLASKIKTDGAKKTKDTTEETKGGKDGKGNDKTSAKEKSYIERMDGKEVTKDNAVVKVVERCEKEVKRLEEELTTENDKTLRSILEIQLKGVQRALKDSLLNRSLVQNHYHRRENKNDNEGKEEMSIDIDEETEVQIIDIEGDEEVGNNQHNTDTAIVVEDEEMTDDYNVSVNVVFEPDKDDYDEEEGGGDRRQSKKGKKDVGTNLGNEGREEVDKNGSTGEKENEAWEDISDDETVKMNSTTQDDSEQEWKTVESKKTKKTKKDENKKINRNENEGTKQIEHKITIDNPYNKSRTKLVNQHKSNEKQDSIPNTNKSSLTTYMEITKEKPRTPNTVNIRFTTSFTPRLSGAGEYKRIAKELLAYATDFAPEVMLLQWDEHSDLGPINVEDLNNPRNYTDTIELF